MVGVKGGHRTSTKGGVCRWKASETTLPPMALCREMQTGGVPVGQQWWQLDDDEEVGPMHGIST